MRLLSGCRKFMISSVIAGAVVVVATPGFADVACVQRELTELGYDPGPIDGDLGRRTREAVDAFAAAAGLSMPSLSGDTSTQWCTALRRQAAGDSADSPVVNGLSAVDFDTGSKPAGLLSQARLEASWTLHERAKRCFNHEPTAKSIGYKLNVLSAEALAELTLQSPFPAAAQNPGCSNSFPMSQDAAPEPLIEVDLNNEFFQQTAGLRDIIKWFAGATMRARYQPSAEQAGPMLKEALVTWADANALRRGLMEPDGRRVDWELSTLIATLVHAYAESLDLMSGEERGKVGVWLNKLVKQVAANTYGDWRSQNRPYLDALAALTWGLTVGDHGAVENAIKVYKLAIHDMRPDGSHVIDSTRSGVALHANQMATGNLIMIASTLKASLGLDIFAYEVDGRSIHTAVEYVLNTMDEPALNKKYAIACDDAAGTIDDPNMSWVNADPDGQEMPTAYLLVYASMFPDGASANRINSRYGPSSYTVPLRYQPFGGSPVCLLNVNAPTAAAISDLLPATHTVYAWEGNGNTGPADTTFDSNMKVTVEGADFGQIEFTLRGNTIANKHMGVTLDLWDDISENAELVLSCGAGLMADEEGTHVRIRFKPASGGSVNTDAGAFILPNGDCFAGKLPEEAAAKIKFLVENFEDVAVGMARNGRIDEIGNDGLKSLMKGIATGKITVTNAPG